ncbi:MAG: ABC transporter ATP-binding protein [Planctomycetota bacterium JB042]
MTETLLVVDDITRSYKSGARDLTVLDGVSFEAAAGETLAIVGPSGSGKSTLLGLCAGLDRPTRGRVVLAGEDLDALDEDARAELRARRVGFVFQSFRLLPTLTALENVRVPAEILGDEAADAFAHELLERVGLGDRLDHYPAQLSGGEQQRVALARAFCNRPGILFADEPTGNLDGETGRAVVESLFGLNREHGTTLVLVTHDRALAERTGRVLSLADGRLAGDVRTDDAVGAGREAAAGR